MKKMLISIIILILSNNILYSSEGGAAAARPTINLLNYRNEDLDKLIKAIYESANDEEVLQLLKKVKASEINLLQNADPNKLPLISAVIARRGPKIVSALLAAGFDSNQTDSRGRNALYYAKNLKDYDVAEIIRKINTPAGRMRSLGQAEQTAAVFKRSTPSPSASPRQSPLSVSPQVLVPQRPSPVHASPVAVRPRAIVSDITALDRGTIRPKNAETLFEAVANDDIVLIDNALAAGEDIDATTEGSKLTALMYATIKGHTKSINHLIGLGANPNLQDINGYTIIEHAKGKGKEKIRDVIIEAIKIRKDQYGYPPVLAEIISQYEY